MCRINSWEELGALVPWWHLGSTAHSCNQRSGTGGIKSIIKANCSNRIACYFIVVAAIVASLIASSIHGWADESGSCNRVDQIKITESNQIEIKSNQKVLVELRLTHSCDRMIGRIKSNQNRK